MAKVTVELHDEVVQPFVIAKTYPTYEDMIADTDALVGDQIYQIEDGNKYYQYFEDSSEFVEVLVGTHTHYNKYFLDEISKQLDETIAAQPNVKGKLIPVANVSEGSYTISWLDPNLLLEKLQQTSTQQFEILVPDDTLNEVTFENIDKYNPDTDSVLVFNNEFLAWDITIDYANNCLTVKLPDGVFFSEGKVILVINHKYESDIIFPNITNGGSGAGGGSLEHDVIVTNPEGLYSIGDEIPEGTNISEIVSHMLTKKSNIDIGPADDGPGQWYLTIDNVDYDVIPGSEISVDKYSVLEHIHFDVEPDDTITIDKYFYSIKYFDVRDMEEIIYGESLTSPITWSGNIVNPLNIYSKIHIDIWGQYVHANGSTIFTDKASIIIKPYNVRINGKGVYINNAPDVEFDYVLTPAELGNKLEIELLCGADRCGLVFDQIYHMNQPALIYEYLNEDESIMEFEEFPDSEHTCDKYTLNFRPTDNHDIMSLGIIKPLHNFRLKLITNKKPGDNND